MENKPENLYCHGANEATVKLMAFCRAKLPGSDRIVEIERGMSVRSKDACEVGKVAAAAVDRHSSWLICLILGHLPENGSYQSIPATWIERVDSQGIELNVVEGVVKQLPDWHPA